jgi:hypothetical protein
VAQERPVIRRAAYRLLLLAGVVYVVNLAVLSWLWRHRGAVVRLLAEAAAELGRGPGACPHLSWEETGRARRCTDCGEQLGREPGAGEGAPGSRTSPPSARGWAETTGLNQWP